MFDIFQTFVAQLVTDFNVHYLWHKLYEWGVIKFVGENKLLFQNSEGSFKDVNYSFEVVLSNMKYGMRNWEIVWEGLK